MKNSSSFQVFRWLFRFLIVSSIILLISACDERGLDSKTSAGQTISGSKVEIVKSDTDFQLTLNQEAYFIKGVGGNWPIDLDEVVKAGGNSIRTWGTDNLQTILDQAYKRQITVMACISLGSEQFGFDYSDAASVAAQKEKARKEILRYKNHPALLLWSIGNESETDGDNTNLWNAVNNIAKMAKELDPNHPTMAIIAELGIDSVKVKEIHKFCPDIDIVGVNAYGGCLSIFKRYTDADGTKPYIIAEFGPIGQWEMGQTAWGAPPEMSSTDKAKFYRLCYTDAIQANRDICLGSYVFIWGHKQEATSTWYGMFLADGAHLGSMDVMTEMWSGKIPENRCPVVSPLKIEGSDQRKPGELIKVSIDISEPDGDPVTVKWVLMEEAKEHRTWGKPQPVPPSFPDAIVEATNTNVTVRMPLQTGAYRLFMYAYDGKGAAATANIPLLVTDNE